MCVCEECVSVCVRSLCICVCEGVKSVCVCGVCEEYVRVSEGV